MLAPQILQVGTPQNVFVEIQDYKQEESVNVQVVAMNFPLQDTDLGKVDVKLTPENEFKALAPLNVSPSNWSQRSNRLLSPVC